MIREALNRLFGGVLVIFGLGMIIAAIWAIYDTHRWGYVGIALLAFAAIAFGWPRLFPSTFEPIPIANDDPLMKAATERARQELPRFRRGVAEGRKQAFIKFPLRSRAGNVEHIWGLVHSLEGGSISVTLANDPIEEPASTGADPESTDPRLAVRADDVEDWMLVAEDGATEGGYSHFAMVQIYRREKGYLPRVLRKSLRNFRDVALEELDAEPAAVGSTAHTGVDGGDPERSSGAGALALVALALALGGAAYYGRVRVASMHDDLVQYSGSGLGALAAYLTGDYRTAAERYRQHFVSRGVRSTRNGDASEAHLLAGDLDGAERLASHRLRQVSDDGASLMTLAQVALARGQLDVADNFVARATGRVPRGVRDEPTLYALQHEAWLVKAAIEMARGNHAAARRAMGQFLRKERPPARMSVYITLLRALGDLEAGAQAEHQWPLRTSLYHYLALWDRARYATMADTAYSAIAAGQEPADAYVAVALVRLREEDSDGALEALRSAIRIEPRHAQAMHAAAEVYENRGDLVNAYEMLQGAWQAQPLDGWHHDALMVFLSRKLGDYRRAIEVAHEYLASKPQDVQGLYWVGHLYWLTGDLTRSSEHFARAVALEPDDAALHEHLADNFERMGRFEEAIASYRQAINVAPRRASSKRQLAGLFRNRMEYATAIPLYEAAFADAAPTAAQRSNLCAAYAAVSRYDEALHCFQLVRRADPNNALAARLLPEVQNNLRLRGADR